MHKKFGAYVRVSNCTCAPFLLYVGIGANADRALVNSNGSVHYRPVAGFVGEDTLTYIVGDRLGGQAEGL